MYGKLLKWALVAYVLQAVAGAIIGAFIGVQYADVMPSLYGPVIHAINEAIDNARLF